MGVGDALSGKSESEVTVMEREREKWEYNINPEGEVKEMVDLYCNQGLAIEDATTIVRIPAHCFRTSERERLLSSWRLAIIAQPSLNPGEHDGKVPRVLC